VYTQDDMAIGALVLDKKLSDADAKKLAEKYAKERKEEYKDRKVNVQAVRDGKKVANIMLE
jgi:cytochrome c553